MITIAKRLSGKVIGLETGRELGMLGAIVVIGSRNSKKGDAAAEASALKASSQRACAGMPPRRRARPTISAQHSSGIQLLTTTIRRVPPKMGSDSMSVVDAKLKVYGIESLRIADGFIMPRVTTGNTMAPCVIISERAREILKADHNL